MSANVEHAEALRIVREQLAEAAAARKCHGCGCLHATVDALARTQAGRAGLSPALADARRVFVAKKYDCLGCEVCYPAIAANAFAEAFPGEAAALDLCPAEAPQERRGWPPVPGDYRVVRYQAPVAVCTLNSDTLMAELAEARPEGLAVAGALHTENLGIERLIRNVLANPHIRVLLLCGEDTRQAIGHLPGQTLESLFTNGIDEDGRIRGARGKRPLLKNVTREHVEAFRRQVLAVPRIGETDASRMAEDVRRCAAAAPGPFDEARPDVGVAAIEASEADRLILDPAGYCVVYPDPSRRRLLVEHYTNAGVLDCVIEGATASAVYATLIRRELVSRLDHAAYLGRELARAERCVETGEAYVQDRAPGGTKSAPASSSGCADDCGTGEGGAA